MLREVLGAMMLKPDQVRLSVREREVIRLVRDGLENADIAREMGVTLMTAQTWVHRLYGKLEIPRGRNRRVLLAMWGTGAAEQGGG